jgi:hypothetical protein
VWESCFVANRYRLPSGALFPKDILPPLIISKSDIVSIINNSFTMAFSLTSCPRCMQMCSPLGQPGTSSFSFNVPSWSTEYVCGQCVVQPWFECCHSSCMIPLRKNVFHTLKQLRAHARHWHVQLASPEENSLVLNMFCCTDDSDSKWSYTDEFDNV